MSDQLPSVIPIPPSRELHYDHHGPSTGALGLPTDTGNPVSFHNPWPSYRFATLSDAWQAYQRGAAVAPAQKENQCSSCGEWSRVAMSRSNSRVGSFKDYPEEEEGKETSGAGGLFYDPDDDDDDNEQEWGDTEDEKDDLSYLAKRIEHENEPVSCYIRPEMKEIQSDDEDDDWREPPVIVRPPRWMQDVGRDSDRGEKGPSKPAVTWLGHASTLVQIPFQDGSGMCNVLFDPIFSERCSPVQYVGPARYLDPPCSIAELPPVHIVIISHDHYDHLDYNTIKDIWNYHNETVHFVVPLNVKRWFLSGGIAESRVTELDWWCEALVQFPATPNPSSGVSTPNSISSSYPPIREAEVDPTAKLSVKVACLPAQHRSGRGLMDQMSSLWASWAIGVVPSEARDPLAPGMASWPTFKAYFGGDTGYRYASAPDSDETAICPAFSQIGEAYGPFSLALLPLSTGSSLPFLRKVLNLSLDQYTLTSSQHCSPADSLKIHAAVRARRTVGMHWGTFCDSAEARATRVDFGRARRDAAVGKDWENPGIHGTFIAPDIGETIDIEP